MLTQVEFRSSKFPPYDGEQDEINEGLWGKRLAEHLCGALQHAGIRANDYAIEDWGCYIPVFIGDVHIGVCCGHQYGDDDEFVIFTDPKQPVMRRWFKKIDRTESFQKLLSALKVILESDAEISDICWSNPDT